MVSKIAQEMAVFVMAIFTIFCHWCEFVNFWDGAVNLVQVVVGGLSFICVAIVDG